MLWEIGSRECLGALLLNAIVTGQLKTLTAVRLEVRVGRIDPKTPKRGRKVLWPILIGARIGRVENRATLLARMTFMGGTSHQTQEL